MQKPDFLKGRKGITFVDLFAGAGGFSEGFMQAYTDKNYYDFIWHTLACCIWDGWPENRQPRFQDWLL